MQFDKLPKKSAPRPGPVFHLEEIAKVLAGKEQFCKVCGAPFPLFPPDDLNAHYFGVHAETIEPEAVTGYLSYQNETDLVKRAAIRDENLITYTMAILTERYDLRKLCVDAGAVVLPVGGVS